MPKLKSIRLGCDSCGFDRRWDDTELYINRTA